VGLDPLYGQLLTVVGFRADPVEVPLVQYAVAVDVRVAAGVDGENHVLLVQAPAQQRVGAQEQDEQWPRHVVAASQHRRAGDAMGRSYVGGRSVRRRPVGQMTARRSATRAILPAYYRVPVMSRAPVSRTLWTRLAQATSYDRLSLTCFSSEIHFCQLVRSESRTVIGVVGCHNRRRYDVMSHRSNPIVPNPWYPTILNIL